MITEPGEIMTPIILLHGLLMPRRSMAKIEASLKRNDEYLIKIIGYSSRNPDIDAITRECLAFTQGNPEAIIIGHSMGGLIARQLVEDNPGKFAKVITLGTPHTGAFAARRLISLKMGALLGKAKAILTEDRGPWSSDTPLYSIAGNTNIGIFRALLPMRSSGDGTVLVDETRVQNAAMYVSIGATHFSMLLDPAVLRIIERIVQLDPRDKAIKTIFAMSENLNPEPLSDETPGDL